MCLVPELKVIWCQRPYIYIYIYIYGRCYQSLQVHCLCLYVVSPISSYEFSLVLVFKLFCHTSSYILWPVPVFTSNLLTSALPNHRQFFLYLTVLPIRCTMVPRFFFHPLLTHSSKHCTKHDSCKSVYSVFLSNSFQAFKGRLYTT